MGLMLTLVGGSLLSLGILLLIIKLLMVLAWSLAIPLILIGVICLAIGWGLTR